MNIDNIFNNENNDNIDELKEESFSEFLPDDDTNDIDSNFFNVPKPIKNKIGTSIGIMTIIMIIIIFSGFLIKDFNNIPLLIAFFIFYVYNLFCCLSLYIGVRTNGYITFSGEVVDVQKEMFARDTFNVQMYDNEREAFISFKYCSKIIPSETIPITLYVYPNEPIKTTDTGYFVEHYLAVVFSSNFDDMKEDITAKDI